MSLGSPLVATSSEPTGPAIVQATLRKEPLLPRHAAAGALPDRRASVVCLKSGLPLSFDS